MTYHFFLKIESQQFHKKYKNIYQSILQVEKIAELYNLENLDPILVKHIDNQFSRKLKLIEKFNLKDTIYIPICYTLISKFPYLPLMEKMLESLIKVSSDSKFSSEDMGIFLNHLINEIPIPPNDKKLIFYLPHLTNELEVVPLLLQDRRLNNFSVLTLFEMLSIENILLIFNILVTEQKILFVHDNRQKLTEAIDCFISLLYPFKWLHTNISILPNDLMKFLESFMPYIMGIEESTFSNKKNMFEDESLVIFIVKLQKNSIYTVEKKKPSKITKLIKIPKFPDEIYNSLLKELKEHKKSLEQSKNQQLGQHELVTSYIFNKRYF